MPEGLPADRPLAAVERVLKTYPGGVRALDGVDLRVDTGEIVGLIGANGSGKTTLLGVLSGRVRPDSGRVSVAGYDPQSREARSRSGFASQEQSLDPDMTGRETAAFFARLQGLPRGGIPGPAGLLDAFGLVDRADARVSTYSGGMRQRLHLLLAFLHDPALALLDEPANGIDPEGRETFWRFLRARAQRGSGALLSLHDLAEAAARCTRVAMMAAGRVRVVGTPADLIARHGAWLWRADLMAPSADPAALQARLTALPGGVRQLDLGPQSVSLWLADAGVGDGEILDILASAHCEVKAYHRQRPDLASVYRLAATGRMIPGERTRADRPGDPAREVGDGKAGGMAAAVGREADPAEGAVMANAGGAALRIATAACLRTWQKTIRRPVVLVFSFVQPLMWMLFFGFLFQRYDIGAGPGGPSYLDFLLPGVCVMTVLFGASQSGTGYIRDMQGGFLARMLRTTAPPGVLLGGKLFADVLRLLGQAVVVALLGVALGARLHPRMGPLAIALLQLSLFAWAYASLSCWIALTTRSQETMGVFIQAVNMPLLFTSAVLVPKRHMPGWLGVVAQWNPLTPVAEGLRTALLGRTDAYGFRGAVWAALALAGVGAFLAAMVALRRSRHD